MKSRPHIQRLHPRYSLGNPSIAWISRDGVKIGHLLEIGFGGCAVEVNSSAQNFAFVKSPTKGGGSDDWITLHYLNSSYKIRFGKHAVSSTRLGMEFYFEDTQAFEYIKNIVFPMRCGAATRFMQLNDIKEHSDLPLEYATGGDIPFKLSIDGADGREVPFLSLSLRKDLVLHQFIREQMGIRTMHSIWPGAITGDLRDTEPLDQNLLRSAFGFFWTYSNGDRSNVFCEIALEILRSLIDPISTKK